MEFIKNTPSLRLYCYSYYVTHDLSEGLEMLECWLLTVKSIPGQTWMFQAFFPKYGAVYDKLPISAFRTSEVITGVVLDLADLVWWDCMSHDIQVYCMDFMRGLKVTARTRSGIKLGGKYLFSIDHCHSNPDRVDTNVSECWPEHKSANLIELDNGQIGIYPNNALLWQDDSLTSELEKCPFKCYPDDDFFRVENEERQMNLGSQDEFSYEPKNKTGV